MNATYSVWQYRNDVWVESDSDSGKSSAIFAEHGYALHYWGSFSQSEAVELMQEIQADLSREWQEVSTGDWRLS